MISAIITVSITETIHAKGNEEALKSEIDRVPEDLVADLTFMEVFPDSNMAQAVANELGKSPQDSITQELIAQTTSLSLTRKKIANIEGIQYFIHLESLDLSDNQIDTIPETMNQLTQLKNLILKNNRSLKELPDSIGELPQLSHLDLAWSSLTKLPTSIGDLSKLKKLTIEWNHLTSLPTTIGNLSELEELNARSNEIKSLPTSIGQMTNLKRLSVDENQLTSLPETIGSLSNLEELFLGDNQLTSLPSSFVHLTDLWMLGLENNLLPSNVADILKDSLSLPPEVIDDDEQFKLFLSPDVHPTYEIHSQDELNQQLNSQALSEIVYVIDPDYDYDEEEDIAFEGHQFILDELTDAEGERVSLSDYIADNEVLKEGKVLAKIRATGTGMFPNNSDQAMTDDTLTLVFKKKPILHIRQVILASEEMLSMPTKGYFSSHYQDSQINISSPSGKQEVTPYKEVTFEPFARQFIHDIKPIIPEYYDYDGHIISTVDTIHQPASRDLNPTISLDYTIAKEYWLTVYLKNINNPKPYSWDYSNHSFGEIK